MIGRWDRWIASPCVESEEKERKPGIEEKEPIEGEQATEKNDREESLHSLSYRETDVQDQQRQPNRGVKQQASPEIESLRLMACARDGKRNLEIFFGSRFREQRHNDSQQQTSAINVDIERRSPEAMSLAREETLRSEGRRDRFLPTAIARRRS